MHISTLAMRAVVFLLASLSFACLLGQFYGLWSMHFFACWILPPATALLTLIADATRRDPPVANGPRIWIVQGAIGGLVAAAAYDLYRLPFVLHGTPLFKVFSRFGELILGVDHPRWLVHLTGWTYHFSNGAALGIMFLAMVVRPKPGILFWGAVVWALLVETILLLTPYARFFGLPLNERFLFLTASAHLMFGLVLGTWCRWRLPAISSP